MNWFRQNRFLGTFLAVLGAAILLALVFIWLTKSSLDDARAQYDQQASELGALQRHNPFPSEVNLGKMKTQAQEYGGALTALQETLKGRVLPAAPLAPNEFQAKLNQARAAVTEKARAHKVKLPDNFFLGFDEFAGALPDTAIAPALGQELAQAELLAKILLDAHVEAIVSWRRVPPNERSLGVSTPSPPRKPAAAAKPGAPSLERNVIDLTFTAAPGAMRRVLNQLASAPSQLFVVRTLHILNEKEKGPSREGAAPNAAAPPPTPAPAPGQTPAVAALNFIVGSEHVQTSARVEMLKWGGN